MIYIIFCEKKRGHFLVSGVWPEQAGARETSAPRHKAGWYPL